RTHQDKGATGAWHQRCEMLHDKESAQQIAVKHVLGLLVSCFREGSAGHHSVIDDYGVHGPERFCCFLSKAFHEDLVVEVAWEVSVFGLHSVELIPAAGQK